MSENETILQAIKGGRSIRRFTDEPVPREMILQALEAARWAPSGLNNQPWRFIVLGQDQMRKKALAECTKYSRIIQDAQALIVVLLDKKVMYSQVKDHQAAGACLQNMLLALHSQGLGAVWLGEILNQEAQALKALGLRPQEHELAAVVALGHPNEQGGSERKELTELILEEF